MADNKITRICSIDDCNNVAVRRTWCRGHYREWLFKNANTQTCNADKCKRVHYARGFCHMHYNVWRATQNPDADYCKATGCVRLSVAKGMCSKHYRREHFGLQRNRGHGDTFALRFWSRVNLTADDTRCWVWRRSSHQGHDYGQIDINGKHELVHRVAWMLTYGSMPDGNLLHSCDTPLCVNPKHLRIGTQQDNARDMMLRGRHKTAKLLPDQVRAIRWQLTSGVRTPVLARQLHLPRAVVKDIEKGRTYKWVT